MINIIIYDSSVKPQTPKYKRPVMAAIVKDFRIFICLFISKPITNQVMRLIPIHGDVYLCNFAWTNWLASGLGTLVSSTNKTDHSAILKYC